MQLDKIIKEFGFKATRSSGPGGQHVNKTASKIELSFDIKNSQGLTESEKDLLLRRLHSRISKEGTLTLQCSKTRSQFRNKAIAIEQAIDLLKCNLKVVKPRKKTKPSKSAIEKRLNSKKKQALKKSDRKTFRLD